MFRFNSKTGEWFAPTGSKIDVGYSGHGEGRNNPEMEGVADIGPIPRGLYRIIKPAYSDKKLGPMVMKLEPIDHDALGRSLFRIHGNNHTDDASHGCPVLGPIGRGQIAASEDDELEVYTDADA